MSIANMNAAKGPQASIDLHNRYEEVTQIGCGAYGTVFRGINRSTNTIVALKKVHLRLTEDGIPSSTLREVGLLKHLSSFGHENIVQILDVCHGRRLEKELIMYIVFEYMEQDLDSYVEKHAKSGGLGSVRIRQIARDILQGVEFLHSHRIVHRDLKPQNLLVSKAGRIKLADFGLAKVYDFDMKLTTVVVTLWYRAPEILLGLPYATPVDIWSVGCIIAELYALKPLFCGTSDNHQLMKIFSVLGKPNRSDWPEENVSITYDMIEVYNKVDLRTLLPNLCENGHDLIMKMLTFKHSQRITASDALNHVYFVEEPLNT